ncbi:MAG: Gfo/Idh/MocA family protein [Chthoniobacterales bacterium]
MSESIMKKNLLVIGLGSIGERHLRCFKNLGDVQVAGCEMNVELGEKIAKRYDCPVYPSLDEALRAQTFDAGVVCTLANTHIPITKQCVEAGLHVLIEKPLAVSRDGVEELEKLAAARERILRVAYVHRSMTLFLAGKKILDSGRIGQPRHASLVAGQHFPTCRPAYREIYYTSHERGGGCIQDAITHSVHTMEWMMGDIKSLFTSAEHQVLEGVEVEDTVNMVATTLDGTMLSLAFNQFQAPNEVFLQINGTKGSLRFDLSKSRVGVLLLGDENWTWEEFPVNGRDDFFQNQARYFIDTLAGEETPLATLAEAEQTLRVNIASLESARTHREITL